MLSSLWSVFLLMVALLLVAYIIEMLIKHGFFLSIKSNIHYFRLHTLEKINHVSTQINQTSDLAEQKKLLAQLKSLAEKYREGQEKKLHPAIGDTAEKWYKPYKPLSRFFILVSTSVGFYIVVFALFWFCNGNPYYNGNFLTALKAWLAMDQDPRGFATVVVALFAAVPALLLWFYRDLNSYKERETSYRDVVFSEHKQLVEWATTEAKLDTKEPAEVGTKDTTPNAPMIQVAGIYQLAPFLKDHHANLYQRSTLETLRAIVNAGRSKWVAWVKDYETWIDNGHEWENEPEKPSLTAAEKAVHAVLRENPILFYHQHFNAKDFNLAGFDASELNLIGIDLNNVQLQGANLTRARLHGTNLIGAKLQGAVLDGAQLQSAKLKGSKFQGASLIGAQFQGANLTRAHFHGSDLSYALFYGAQLSGALLQSAYLSWSQLQGVNLGLVNLKGADLSCADLRDVYPLHSLMQASTIEDAIVLEPELVEADKIELKELIKRGAISIANKAVLRSYSNLSVVHSEAVDALAAKGLTATTKESLAESFYPNMDCGLIND